MKELPEIFLKRMDANKNPFKYADSNIGFRSKIGGKPDFISESEYPLCPECNNRMSFYGQLDSIDDDNIRLTNKGIDLANLVWEEFVN